MKLNLNKTSVVLGVVIFLVIITCVIYRKRNYLEDTSNKSHELSNDWKIIVKKLHMLENNTHWHHYDGNLNPKKMKETLPLSKNDIPKNPLNLIKSISHVEMQQKCVSDFVEGVLSYSSRDDLISSQLVNYDITSDGNIILILNKNTWGTSHLINKSKQCSMVVYYSNQGICIKYYGKIKEIFDDKLKTELFNDYSHKEYSYKYNIANKKYIHGNPKIKLDSNDLAQINDIYQKMEIPDILGIFVIETNAIIIGSLKSDYSNLENVINYKYERIDQNNWNIIELNG